MSVSITNSIPPHQPTATVTAQVDTTKNAEPLAVR
ncbi:unnamed protein product, partial [Rotaria socialis]